VILVVGAGVTGLAAAFELTRRGLPVTLVEASGRAGGLIVTERVGGFVIDGGPDALLAQKPAAVQLCEDLGLGDRLMSTLPPRTAFVLKHGRLHPLPSPSVLGIPTTLRAVRRYDLLSWRGRARLALEPVVPRREPGDESVASFFRRRFGEETVGLVAEPLLAGIHAGDVEALSVASLFPRLVEAEQQPGKVLRTLGARTPPRGQGLFRALRGGMGELVDALLARLPEGTLQLATCVEGLQAAAGGWRAAALDRSFDAGAVILAVPAHVVALLLAAIDPRAGELCAGVPYVSTASVALGWRREDVRHPLAGSGFVVARACTELRMTACTWVSSKWAHRAPEGHVLLRAFLGGAHDPSVVELPDEALAGVAIREIQATLGITAPPMLSRVYRTRRGGAQHHVGHGARMAELMTRLQSRPGLFAAGSGFEAVGIPDCIEHGRRAAAAAAAYVGARDRSS